MNTASLVHGSNMSRSSALALMSSGRRASRPATVAPVRPRASVADRRFFAVSSGIVPGVTHTLHRGTMPTLVAGDCYCACHGNGDPTGRSCDERRCVEVGERMPMR